MPNILRPGAGLMLPVCLLLPAAALASAPRAAPDLASAQFHPNTTLVREGRADCVIVAPSSEPEAAAVASRVADGIGAKYGLKFPIVSDVAVCRERLGPVGREHQQTNLIVVGNLCNNRAIFPLYVQFLCSADSHYPGGDGYELRTIGNPWGTGRNVVVVGASSPAGLRAAADAVLRHLPETDDQGATLPHLIAVRPGKGLEPEFESIRARVDQYQRPTAGKHYGLERFYRPAFRYYWTADRRWAELARDYIRHFNAEFKEKYRVSHYNMETMFRAWDMVEESPVFTDEERRVTARNFALTMLSDPSYASGPRTHVGSTHCTLPTMAHWVACRYLRRTYPDSDAFTVACLERERRTSSFFRGTADTSYRDDTDSGGTSSIAVYMRWAAASGQREFFDNGHARAGAQFALSLNDPLGYDAGMSTYGAARIGAIYHGYSSLYHLQLASFVYGDPLLHWLVRRVPNRRLDLYGQAQFPFNTCAFSLPEGSVEQEPAHLHGLSIVPLSPRRYEYLAAKKAMPPHRETFDKLTFRSGFEPSAQYLILQGNESKSRDGNTIPRYTDQGHVWLTHNTSQVGHYYRNGLFITDGQNDEMDEMSIRLGAAGRFGAYGVCSSTLRGFCGVAWQRTVFCQTADWFVVMDRAVVKRPGRYSAQMIWRMPVGGIWRGNRFLAATQGDRTFHLMSAAAVDATGSFERPAGGPPDIHEQPFMLRQRTRGRFETGDVVDFQNLLTVADAGRERPYTISRIDSTAALVRHRDAGAVVVGVAGEGPVAGVEVDDGAYLVVVGADDSQPMTIHVAGARRLTVGGRTVFSRQEPVTATVELETGRMTWGYNGDELKAAALTWRLPESRVEQVQTTGLAASVRERLARFARPVASVREPVTASPDATHAPRILKTLWENSDIGSSGRRVQGARIHMSGDKWYGRISSVFDGLIPVRAGGVSWEAGQTARFGLSWGQPKRIREVRLHMSEIGRRGDIAPAEGLAETRPIAVTWSSDGHQTGRRVVTQTVRSGHTIYPNYKNFVQAQKLLRVNAGVVASGLQLEIPPAESDWHGRVVIGEIEIVADERGPLAIHQVRHVDLDGDRAAEWIINAGEGFLTVLSADGQTKWRKTFVAEVSCIDTGDLDGDGKQEVLCGCYDMRVRAFRADGALVWETDLNQLRDRTSRKFSAESPTPFGVGFWEPRPGLRRVLVGNYENCLMVLDVKGKVIQQYYPGFSMFQRRFVDGGVDLSGDGLDEKLMCSMKYGAYGAIHALVADEQGLVAAHRNVGIPDNLPYVVELVGPQRSRVAVITPTGYGLYDLAENFPDQQRGWYDKSVWQSRGSRPVSAGLLHDIDGDGVKEYLVGGRDGFVTVIAMDGQRRGSRLLGYEVLGLSALGAGDRLRLFVATEAGLLVLDSDWNVVGAEPGHFTGVWPADADKGTVLAATQDGRLKMVKLER